MPQCLLGLEQTHLLYYMALNACSSAAALEDGSCWMECNVEWKAPPPPPPHERLLRGSRERKTEGEEGGEEEQKKK